MSAFKEKNQAALSSVFAAVFLTLLKLIVGISTNSLGILSEAAHSGLDLVAALATFIAIKYSSKPADEDHHFGHGKSENISALFQTVLLLITCAWIIFEVVERLSGKHFEMEVSIWSFLVIITSIVVDISRSRMLKRVAKKYNSQALEADALHFSSDIFSSGVVLIGLAGFYFGYQSADSIAALIVAVLVIGITARLGKRAIDELLDKAPSGIKQRVKDIAMQVKEVERVHDIKVRSSGSCYHVEMNIHVNPDLTIEKAHQISHQVESDICREINGCEVMVHIEPEKISQL